MWRSETMTRDLAVAAAILLACAGSAMAQDDSGVQNKRPMVTNSTPPSPNATINLINLLVKQGVLTEEQAAALVKQADDEAYVARQAVRDATAKAEGADKKASAASDATSAPGTKRVTYVPELVRKQLRDEIKAEVMEKAEKENWASPGKYPEWAQRIRFYGDVRVRYEGDLYPKGNYPGHVNYNAINTGSPYNVDVSNPYLWPTLNADQDRNRARLRARLGMDADLFDGFTAGVRIASGDSSSPVSFNQTLGGSGGNFSKYGIWLDRAFIKYSPWSDLAFHAGRFDNPFFMPTDLVFAKDMAFDGFAGQFKYEVEPGITPFVAAGAFPIFNTDLNVGTSLDFNNPGELPGKAPSHDKWMFGAQIGSNFRPTPEVDFTFGAAYFDYVNVQGRLSDNCIVATAADFCSTDLTRPSFAQRGNSYMALRQLDPVLSIANGAQFQYFGLASDFKDLVVSAKLDLGHFHPVHVILDGEYVRNLAWNGDDVAAKVMANPLLSSAQTTDGVYRGGNQGWLARMTVGNRELKQLWDWNVHVGYKYLESDAVIDAFTDSDFGLGGTNLKGYFVGGNLALGPSVWTSLRWMSANQVAGMPYAVDVVQLDLNARF